MQVEQIRTPKKKKWIIIGIIAFIVIIAAVNVAVMQSKKKSGTEDLKFVSVTEKEINNTKLISGRVVPGNMEMLYADSTRGKVKELFVKEGQEIEKGQKLFSYDNPELSIQIKQLEIEKKTTKMQYDQGNDKVDSLKKGIQKAKNAGADKETTDPLEAQLQEAQLQQKTAELTMEKNKLQAEELQRKQDDLIVYSSTAGIVQKVDKDVGQSSSQTAGVQGKPIIQIASKDPFQVQGTLTELQKAQIQPNQSITVTSKAVSNKTWKGKIIEVSQYPTSDEIGQSAAGTSGQTAQNISYYNFKASLDSQDGLSPGYHVAIQVELTSKKMLAVPRSSIVEKGDSPFVYVVNDKKLRKQKVTTGMSDGEWIEVLEGLKVGEKVVGNPSSTVHDGMEVKVK
ncbi:efflux RND transporter periplasmic adaptor subunit [Bacillus sp. CGMCC 1.60114]|uniref:efflux RND transporter periplasmic adaptor subunit n=1 Tax=unclassified Bacillus (in: firmicutes) TaxID=185979 RepID=UPI00363A0037